MSIIQEALNRAHSEGDDRYQKYGGIFSPVRKKKRPSPAKLPVWIFMIFTASFVGLVSYSSMGIGSSCNKVLSEASGIESPLPIEQGLKCEAKGLFDRAMAFHESGHLEDAQRLYVETLRIDPRYVEALNNLGVILIQARDFQTARINLEKAIRLKKPLYVDPYYNLACVFALKGEISESIAYLKKGAAIDQSVKDWARHDTDLKNLWGVPGFQALINKTGFSPDSYDPKL